MGIFAVLLSYVSFKLINQAGGGYAYLVYAIVFTGISATMVWNDYQDREIDKTKGKTTASNQPIIFFRYSLVVWLILIVLNCSLLFYGLKPFVFSMILTAIGFYYNSTKKIFLLPTFTVAIFCALLVFYPLVHHVGASTIWQFLRLSIFVFVFIYIREIVKDLMDESIDTGYKMTIPLKFGTRTAINIVVILLILLNITFVYTISQTQLFGLKQYFIGFGLISFALAFIMVLIHKYKNCKILMDISGVCALLAFSLL
jgi:4-hydroxybenzoate polyprenyltransferase